MNVVDSPSGADLLKQIEGDPHSFTKGQRNDDVCNWYFAKLLALREGENTFDLSTILRDFNLMMNLKLSPAQVASLKEWDEDWEKKLTNCHKHYSQQSRNYILNTLWIVE